MKPTNDEIREAFQAGLQQIYDGTTFYSGSNAHVEAVGCVKRDDIPCARSDQGSHGHLLECRWVKAQADLIWLGVDQPGLR